MIFKCILIKIFYWKYTLFIYYCVQLMLMAFLPIFTIWYIDIFYFVSFYFALNIHSSCLYFFLLCFWVLFYFMFIWVKSKKLKNTLHTKTHKNYTHKVFESDILIILFIKLWQCAYIYNFFYKEIASFGICLGGMKTLLFLFYSKWCQAKLSFSTINPFKMINMMSSNSI